MRKVFSILLFCALGTSGCVFDDWYWYAECDSDQCQSVQLALDTASRLEVEAAQRFKEEWPEPTSFSLDQAITAAKQSIVSCGLPNDQRISEEAIPDTYPDEIIVNVELFDSDDSEQQELCLIAGSLVHAGAHLAFPEIKHHCQINIDEVEACPEDRQEDDPILAAERSVYQTCIDQ